MKGFRSMAALALAALVVTAGGCVTSEHRMDTAASRDDTRRSEFEHCRAEGRTDCDAILNAPVNSNTPDGDSVRRQERRAAYDRCVERGGTDCDDILHR
jgi:hypothetical protein